jgi:hypothetical protein
LQKRKDSRLTITSGPGNARRLPTIDEQGKLAVYLRSQQTTKSASFSEKRLAAHALQRRLGSAQVD